MPGGRKRRMDTRLWTSVPFDRYPPFDVRLAGSSLL